MKSRQGSDQTKPEDLPLDKSTPPIRGHHDLRRIKHATIDLPPPESDEKVIKKRVYYQRTKNKSTLFQEENPASQEKDSDSYELPKNKCSTLGCF